MKTNEHKHQIGKIAGKTGALWGILVVATLALTFGPGKAEAQTRTPGIDVSRWQGTINWTSVRNSGIRFAWAQATRGLTSPNANFVANMNNGKSANVYMGAYHYAFPGDNSAQTEADYFWNLAGPYIKADGKTLMPMLDIEVWTGHVGASSYTDWANQWCNAIIAKAAAAGVTVKPVIYTSACFACNFDSGISQWGSFIANYNGQNPSTGTPWSACSSCNRWGTWHFWQYTDTGTVPGITGAVDRDMYNGSVTSLVNNWIAQAYTPAPGNNAAPVSMSHPTLVTTGQSFSATVTMKNTGTTSWLDVNNYKLGSQNPQDNTRWGLSRINVTGTVSPNQNHAFTFTATAPTSAGTYSFDWTMLQEGVQWFGGSAVGTIVVEVPSAAAVIVDNTAATFVGSWSTGSSAGDKYGADYRYRSTAAVSEPATFTANIPAGSRIVFAWWPAGSNRSTTAPYVVYHSGGSTTITKNQQINGGSWQSLGNFNFNAGNNDVKLSCWTTTGYIVVADAVKFGN